jgi:ornithine cyclodeaminase
VAGRNPDRAASLAGEVEAALGVPVRAVGSWAEALDGADVACAATHATEPVVRRAWLPPGIHVNSVGYNPEGREVDGETVRDALVVVESREGALAPVPAGSPDLARAIREGLVTEDHIHTEVGELVAGTKAGRTSPDQITLYKSVGVAVQDAAAAALVLAAARERGVGREVEV